MTKKIFLAVLAVGFVSCASHYVLDPPAVDLAPDGPLGLITFSIINARGDLDGIATQSFLQHVTAAQRVPVLELGKLDGVFTKTGMTTLDSTAAKAIGQSYEVKSFFYGEVRISKVKRQVNLTNVLSGNLAVRASFDIDVTVRLVSAETGATLWTESASRSGTLGTLAVGVDQIPAFAMTDKDREMMDLIRDVMHQLTWDFRPTERRI